MNLNKERQGEALTLIDALIMSIFPVVSIFAMNILPPIFLAGSSILLGGLLSLGVSLYLYGLKRIILIMTLLEAEPSRYQRF